ncbi:hypothetical protein [Rubinisphaera sp. JC750]|uniref:hypothetical protein n=1 Tax=Rubinisphaera sp. JC750 TaxID=2898658 RepID=UPI001F1B6A45|nr:hypothetical protein [Rubinisphaera sp. JC750]
MNERDNARAAFLVKLIRGGILFSLLIAFLGRLIVRVIQQKLPHLLDGGALEVMLPVIWLPAVAAIVLSFYTVIRYPGFLPEHRIFTGRFNPVPRFFAGGGCLLLACFFVPFLFSETVQQASLVMKIFTLGLTCAFAYGGFLIFTFDPDKHRVTASLLEQTFGLAIPLILLYLPALILTRMSYRSWQPEEIEEPIGPETTEAV